MWIMIRGFRDETASGLDALNAGVEKIGKIGPIGQFAVGPQHPVGDLVAHLHHLRHHAGGGEGGDGIAGVVEDGGSSSLCFELAPGRGSGLAAGIGPGVGVVKVEQQMKADRLGALGQSNSVVQIVGQILLARRGIIEDAQPDPVVVVLGQHDEHILWLATFLEDYSILLALCEEGDVRSDSVLLCMDRGQRAKENKQKHCNAVWHRHASIPSYQQEPWRQTFLPPQLIPKFRS